MMFKNREEAAIKLAENLKDTKGQDIVLYAMPRGGVPLGKVISSKINAPLSIIITRKIGHPNNPEYAIGAVSLSGDPILNKNETENIDKDWLKEEIEKEVDEARRRKEKYLGDEDIIDPNGKVAVIVDDGIATGMSIELAVKELKKKNPKKIVIAVPVVPSYEAEKLRKIVDDIIAIKIDHNYLGAVGAYYEDFSQTSDAEVVDIMKEQNERIHNQDK